MKSPVRSLADLRELAKENDPTGHLLPFIDLPQVASRLAIAPASGAVRRHHAYTGGLIDHIFEVDTYAKRMFDGIGDRVNKQLVTHVAILHDIHKIGDVFGEVYYTDNILKSGKQSEAEPFKHNDHYEVKLASVVGAVGQQAEAAARVVKFYLERYRDRITGGDQSLALVNALAPALYAALSPDQIFAIRYHDGVYATSKYEKGFIGQETPLQIVIHAADMLSSRLATT